MILVGGVVEEILDALQLGARSSRVVPDDGGTVLQRVDRLIDRGRRGVDPRAQWSLIVWPRRRWRRLVSGERRWRCDLGSDVGLVRGTGIGAGRLDCSAPSGRGL